MRAAETSKHEVSEVGCIFGSSIPIALAGGAKHVVRLGRQIHFGEKTTMRKLTIATLGLMLAAFAGSAFARPVMDDTATDTTKTKTTKSHKKKTTDTTDTTVTTKATKAAADTGKMASDTGSRQRYQDGRRQDGQHCEKGNYRSCRGGFIRRHRRCESFR